MNLVFKFLAVALLAMPFACGSAFAQDDDVKVVGPSSNDAVVYVTVTQNRQLVGSIVDMADLKVTTGFGEVSVPMSSVDGIKMDADGKGSAVVAFKNGDVLTGAVSLDTVVLKTDWGKAHVGTQHIVDISMTRNGRFVRDSSGNGWRYSRATVTPSTTRSTNPNVVPRGNGVPRPGFGQ